MIDMKVPFFLVEYDRIIRTGAQCLFAVSHAQVRLGEHERDLELKHLSMVGATMHMIKSKFNTDCICVREQWPPDSDTSTDSFLFVDNVDNNIHYYDTRHYFAARLVQKFIRRRAWRRRVREGKQSGDTTHSGRTAEVAHFLHKQHSISKSGQKTSSAAASSASASAAASSASASAPAHSHSMRKIEIKLTGRHSRSKKKKTGSNRAGPKSRTRMKKNKSSSDEGSPKIELMRKTATGKFKSRSLSVSPDGDVVQ